jgi:hypothetical protein
MKEHIARRKCQESAPGNKNFQWTKEEEHKKETDIE